MGVVSILRPLSTTWNDVVNASLAVLKIKALMQSGYLWLSLSPSLLVIYIRAKIKLCRVSKYQASKNNCTCKSKSFSIAVCFNQRLTHWRSIHLIIFMFSLLLKWIVFYSMQINKYFYQCLVVLLWSLALFLLINLAHGTNINCSIWIKEIYENTWVFSSTLSHYS